ncbi:SDR family NAD(P)-dependent oxidoreductase [Archangium lipolyticum]|uniref:SDR family NAD(P)-dependent oxidoreductase n=1 Tax=Archangium lipolyticum TaxID=2970465 RepID=UPI002149A650|nr:SDR family NAD(P)-dependent oxidoreductase [Archangium lipolyticum]
MRPPIDSGTVLITGACSVIGREIARQLARRARTLVLVASEREPLEELRDELLERNPTLGVAVEKCDLSHPDEVDALLDSLHRHLIHVDVLVNNADQGEYGLYEQQRWPRIHQMLRANVSAPMLLTHRLLRRMVERGRGGILNIGSGGGRLYIPGMAVYAGTRHFLEGFSESLRLELAGTGVVVTRVEPGPVAEGEALAHPPSWMSISAVQCAREALEGFEHASPLVYPGLAYRWMMRLVSLMPRPLMRATGLMAAKKLRRATSLLEDRGQQVLLASGSEAS